MERKGKERKRKEKKTEESKRKENGGKWVGKLATKRLVTTQKKCWKVEAKIGRRIRKWTDRRIYIRQKEKLSIFWLGKRLFWEMRYDCNYWTQFSYYGGADAPYTTGIKALLSDQTSGHHGVVTWYYESNEHYLANHFENRFFNKIILKHWSLEITSYDWKY